MRTILITVESVQKFKIVNHEVIELRNRNQIISSEVTDFVLDITFFMTFIGIHEYSLESAMFLESGESFGEIPAAAFDDVCHHGRAVVKPNLAWHSSNMTEDCRKPFKQTLGVFAV